MTMPAAMISSRSVVWETPQDFFNALNTEFGFTLDVCALPSNAKCPRYFTPEDDGLAQDWAPEICWMNPPYGPHITGRWMAKALAESRRGATVVCLVPARTDTRWWHDTATRGEVRFVKGRLKFRHGTDASPKWSAVFPSAVIIFRPETKAQGVTVWGRKCNACGLNSVWRRNARYCSNVCRQRAYRSRKNGSSS